MRVLFLSTWFPYPPDNGSKLRAYHLIHSLAQSHDVTVIAFNPQNRRSATLSSILLCDNALVWGVPEDPFRYVNLPRIAKYFSPIPLAAWLSRRMHRAVQSIGLEGHWDAVVAFQTPIARYALMPNCAARVFDIDNALSFLAAERLAAQRATGSRVKAQASLLKSYLYEARLARRFHACTVVSPLEIDFIRKMVSGTSCHVEVSDNGVDCRHNRPSSTPPEPNALVYSGALTYSANYDAMRWFLAEIYPRIRAQQPGITLTITGSTEGVDLHGLGLDDSVRLTGNVEDVRLPVTGATACVVPVRQGGGTRLKILEAMALGTPVVATSKGAEGLGVTDGEHLLIADDSDAFARQAVAVLRNPELREHLIVNARHLVETRYNWDQIGRRFVDLVEATVDARRGRPG